MAEVLTVYVREEPAFHPHANRGRARTTSPSSQAALMQSGYHQLYHSSEIFEKGGFTYGLNPDNHNRAKKQSGFFRTARWQVLGKCLTVLWQQYAPVA